MRLQQRAQARIVGLLGAVVAHRAAEQHRLPHAGGPGRVRVGGAEPFIGQQAAYLLIAGNQPRLVLRHGGDPVDQAILRQISADQARQLGG